MASTLDDAAVPLAEAQADAPATDLPRTERGRLKADRRAAILRSAATESQV